MRLRPVAWLCDLSVLAFLDPRPSSAASLFRCCGVDDHNTHDADTRTGTIPTPCACGETGRVVGFASILADARPYGIGVKAAAVRTVSGQSAGAHATPYLEPLGVGQPLSARWDPSGQVLSRLIVVGHPRWAATREISRRHESRSLGR